MELVRHIGVRRLMGGKGNAPSGCTLRALLNWQPRRAVLVWARRVVQSPYTPGELPMTRQTSPPSPQLADKAQSETKPKHGPAPAGERIRPAVAGDSVPWEIIPGRQKIPHHVQLRCGATSPGSYICLVCRVYLANVTQLNFHTEQGEHVIARVCSLHGAEEV